MPEIRKILFYSSQNPFHLLVLNKKNIFRISVNLEIVNDENNAAKPTPVHPFASWLINSGSLCRIVQPSKIWKRFKKDTNH